MPKGEFIREIGKGLYGWSFAHTVRIDKDDNIWAVDKGSDMIIKFNPAGPRGLRCSDAGRNRPTTSQAVGARRIRRCRRSTACFRQPTDVAWDSEGNIYITDGYVNSRVAKYDKNGDWVKSWGETGHRPGAVPHAARDRHRPQRQHLCRRPRATGAFRCSIPTASSCGCSRSTSRRRPGPKPVNGNTPTGARLTAVIGAPNSLCITPGPNQVMFVGESTFPGRIFKVTLDGKVLGVIGKSGRQLKQFSGAHQLACPSENEIYVAESSNWRVQKLILRAQSQTTSAAR